MILRSEIQRKFSKIHRLERDQGTEWKVPFIVYFLQYGLPVYGVEDVLVLATLHVAAIDGQQEVGSLQSSSLGQGGLRHLQIWRMF